MVNKVILIGNLGRDPEISYTQSGVAVCKTSLATTERWTTRDGEKQERTDWHNLVFWRRQAEVANEFLRKGSRIYVEGRIVYRSWEGQDGVKRTASDIEVQNFQMLTPRGEGGSSYSQQSTSKPAQQAPAATQPQEKEGIHYEPEGTESFGNKQDDDLPF